MKGEYMGKFVNKGVRKLEYEKSKTLHRMLQDLNFKCKVPGCCEPLTPFTGLGATSLCYEHQRLKYDELAKEALECSNT